MVWMEIGREVVHVLFIRCYDNVTGGVGKPSCFSPRTGWFDKRRRVEVEADALERQVAGLD